MLRFRPRHHSLLLLLLAAILPALLAGSCSESNLPVEEPKLVVEGWIDSEGYATAVVSLSAVPSENAVSVAESIVRWGVVTLSDGSRTAILTGGPSDDYFPPFRYYTFDFYGTPGKTYTLTAEYQGKRVSSTVTMPEPTPITALERTPIAGADSLCHLVLRFSAPQDVPAYYHVSYRISGERQRFLPSMLGAVIATEPGQEMEVPVYQSKSSLSTVTFQPEMPARKAVTVKLERVTPEVYAFWHAFDDAALVEGSIFVNGPGSLPSNILGGYGVFSAQGVSLSTSLPLP